VKIAVKSHWWESTHSLEGLVSSPAKVKTVQRSKPVSAMQVLLLPSVQAILATNYCTYSYKKKTPWTESAGDLCRPSDRRLSVKLILTFSDRGMSRGQRGGSRMAVISDF
jgi:hypothetical protein